MKRALTTTILLGLLLFAAGCSGGPKGLMPSQTDPTNGSSVALKAARAQIQTLAPDAVPVMITSSGSAVTPPLKQWSVLFVSPAKGRLYNVPVNGEQAQAAQDVGLASTIPAASLKAAVDYDTLKVGSDDAYAKAKAELSKTGPVSDNLMESIALIQMADLPESMVGVWEVAFLTGTDPNARRTALVDAMSGAVTETTKK